MSASVIIYSPGEILEIGKHITAELDEDIINSLMEIKANNKFIRRRSPVKLKYTMKTWRKEKENIEVSLVDKFVEGINSKLNKLSASNFNEIRDALLEVVQTKTDDEFRQLALDTLFHKAINEANFSDLYARILNTFIDTYGEIFKSLLIEKVKQYYDTNITGKFCINNEKIDYDTLCEINKEKVKMLGSFTYIGSLYLYKYVDSGLVLKYLDILMNSISDTADDDSDVEKYIECSCTLITKIGKQLEQEIGKKEFKAKVTENMRAISKNSQIKPRVRFMIMDILDLSENNWVA